MSREMNELVLRLWEFDDAAGSRDRFLAALDGERDVVRRQVLLTQVARAHGLTGQFDEGHHLLDEIGDDLADEPAVRAQLERGRLLRSSGDEAGSIKHFREAYDRAHQHGLTGLAADAAHMLALVLPAENETWTGRGLEIAEGSDDPLARAMTGALLNNRGWDLADAGRWEEAYALFARAVGTRAEGTQAFHVARWTRARAARALGRHDEALAELGELDAGDPYVTEEIEANEAALRLRNR